MIAPSKIGAVNGVKAVYTVPDSSGEQFKNGWQVLDTNGFSTVKAYLTADYLTDYPLQSTWDGTPTTLKQLAETSPFQNMLSQPWDTVILTTFTFANGTTNWWRALPTKAKLDAEYAEIYELCTYLLQTYNSSGKTFVLQNWEGDWAFGDVFVANSNIDRKFVDYYAAFLAMRQKAVDDARRATEYSGVNIYNAIEVNRVTDAKLYPHRRRIITDIAKRVQPDVVSYSAYDSTIADYGYLGSIEEWQARCESEFGQALKDIRAAFPNAILSIGEFGFPENEMSLSNGGVGYDVGVMIDTVYNVASANGARWFIYWQVFDNETSVLPEGVRGYWLVKPNDEKSDALLKLQELL